MCYDNLQVVAVFLQDDDECGKWQQMTRCSDGRVTCARLWSVSLLGESRRVLNLQDKTRLLTTHQTNIGTRHAQRASNQLSSSSRKHMHSICSRRLVSHCRLLICVPHQTMMGIRRIYTGGADSLVRVWNAERGADQEPDSAIEAQEAVTTVATGVRILLYISS